MKCQVCERDWFVEGGCYAAHGEGAEPDALSGECYKLGYERLLREQEADMSELQPCTD